MKKLTQLSKYAFMAIALTAMVFLTSCKKDDPENSASMEVQMTDSPADFESLVVQITKVEAFSPETGWITVNSNTQSHDILTLTNGTEVTIVDNDKMERADYSKLRLTWGSDTYLVVDVLGVSTEFALLADGQTEIDIETEYDNDGKASITIDFHAGESVFANASAGYDFSPVITEMKNTTTGIEGDLEANYKAYVVVEGQGRTREAYTDDDGKFMVRGMAAGSYDVKFYPEDSDNNGEMYTIENVVVAEGEITSMGNVSF